MPKMKELKIDEGSTLVTTRELDLVSNMDSIIQTSTKKKFTQPPSFGDTEASNGSKAMLPHWGGLFKKMNQEDYPDFTPNNDLDVRILDDQVFPNIRRSYLHMVG